MELYTLDSNLKRVEVIDRFESLIWTERFQNFGDFELVAYSSRKLRSILTPGTKVVTNKSHRVMMVDEIDNKTDNDGKKILTVRGTSLEKVLYDRIASNGLSDLVSASKGATSISVSTSLFTLNDHNLITGDPVYFETTGSIGSLDIGQVKSISSSVIKLINHGLRTGEEVFLKTTGTLPTGITVDTAYYVIYVNADEFKLALTLENAESGTAITMSGSPTGTHTVYKKLSIDPVYYVIYVSDNTFRIAKTYEDALNNQYIYLFGTPTGTHTLYWVNSGKWREKGTAGDIARNIFDRFIFNASLESTDAFPNLAVGNIYPLDTIPEPETLTTMDFQITTVYDAIKEVCDVNALGFRIVRDHETEQLYFNIYSGNDRTGSQDIFDAVIFDATLDTLLGDSEFTSIKSVKNVAYVFSKYGYKTVYANSSSSTSSGFDKRVLYVDANDIETFPGEALDKQLTDRGLSELSKYKTLNAFDGEVPQYNAYVYDKDYILGDLVEVRNNDGYSSFRRVSEQILSDDASGEKSYPTLSSELVLIPGSWLTYNDDQTWSEVPDDLDHEWQDQ